MSIQHWMSFGTFKEQRHFRFPSSETYTGVILNANMVAHAPAGIAAFLVGQTRPDFPYLIDPLTHAFQHDVKHIKSNKKILKQSIKKLSEHYGGLISGIAGERPLRFSDFNDHSQNIDFVEKCLDFQVKVLAKAMEKCEEAKYLLEFEEELNKPYGLVSPYFYLDEMNISAWLPKMVKFCEIALNQFIEEDDKFFVPIVIDSGILLDISLISQITEAFKDLNNTGYLLWINNFDEQNVGTPFLKGMLTLSRLLRRGGKELINLHGGYFSILAATNHFGVPALTGITHGPEYGEFRSVIPVGGGIPIARYYVKQLHSRHRYRDAASLYDQLDWLSEIETFEENVCNCDECSNVIQGDPANFTKFGQTIPKRISRGNGEVTIQYSTKEAKEMCLKHYLFKKADEFEFANSASREAIVEDLNGSIELIEGISPASVKHLKVWKLALGIE